MRRWGFWPCAVAGILLLASEPSLAYYHPTAGRWVSRDPLGYGGGPSLAEYVSSDPCNNADPDGLLGLPDFGGAVSAVGDFARQAASRLWQGIKQTPEYAFKQFASGEGPLDHTYVSGPFLHSLKTSPAVNAARSEAAAQAKENCIYPKCSEKGFAGHTSNKYHPVNATNALRALRDWAYRVGQYAPLEVLGQPLGLNPGRLIGANKATTWLGTFDVYYLVKDVSCYYGEATIEFDVEDYWSASSMTAIFGVCWDPPRLSYLEMLMDNERYRRRVGQRTPGFILPDLPQGWYFGGKVMLHFRWKETLPFQGNCSCKQ